MNAPVSAAQKIQDSSFKTSGVLFSLFKWLPFPLLGVFCIILFFPVTNHLFVYSDNLLIFHTARMSYEDAGGSVKKDDTGWTADQPLPLVYLLQSAKNFWNGRPYGYHVLLLFLHTANVLLLFALFQLVLKTHGWKPAKKQGSGAGSQESGVGGQGRRARGSEIYIYPFLAPLIGAALFAAHPLQAGAVGWFSSIKELLAGFFILGAVALFMADTLRSKQSVTLTYAFSVMLFLIGAFTSAEAWLWFFVFFVQYRFACPGAVRPAERWGRFLKLAPYFIICILSFIIFYKKSAFSGPAGDLPDVPAAMMTAAIYLKQTLLPVGLPPVLHMMGSGGHWNALAVTGATRKHPALYLGVSPRGSLALYRTAQAHALVAGRDFVLPDDVKALAVPVLAHRLVLDPASANKMSSCDVITGLLESIPVPGAAGR